VNTASQGFFTAYELQERGWRLGTISVFFPHPSKIMLGNRDQVGLYLQRMVLDVEASAEFQGVQDEQATKSRKTLAQEIREGRYGQKLKLTALPSQKLRSLALVQYNARKNQDSRRVPLLPPMGFWEQIEVDYILHDTAQSMGWNFFTGRPGRDNDATQTYRILLAIPNAYPQLTEECQRRRASLRIAGSGASVIGPKPSSALVSSNASS
jgi:hypothetical protein